MTDWKPNKWIATALGLFVGPLGFMYANRPKIAAAYLFLIMVAAASAFSTDLLPFLALESWLIALLCAVHAFVVAARSNPVLDRPWFTRWYGLIWMVIAYAVIAVSFRTMLVEPFRIPSSSMEPTLPRGEMIFVKKSGYGNYSAFGIRWFHADVTAPLVRGDILVFELNEEGRVDYVKRLIGLPGDHVVYKNKRLSVNGKPLPTEVVYTGSSEEQLKEGAYFVINRIDAPSRDFDVTVEQGKLFFMGDNRDNSRDSRYIGAIAMDQLVGKVMTTFPPEKAQDGETRRQFAR